MSLKKTILSIDFFNGLDDKQLDILINFSGVKSYAKNSILHYENDTTKRLMFLISGLIKVYKIDKFSNEIFLYHINSNSMISEFSSLEQEEIFCFSNAEFIEDSEILSIDLELFNQHFISQNILTKEFINELLKKTHQLQCIINRELVFDATAKVAFMIDNDLKMFNQLKRQEVSFLLHIQPETLSRVLKKLTRNKVIDIINGEIIVLNATDLTNTYKG